jgi:hypothetical protein
VVAETVVAEAEVAETVVAAAEVAETVVAAAVVATGPYSESRKNRLVLRPPSIKPCNGKRETHEG